MIGERGAADGSEVEANHLVRICLQECCDLFGRFDLALVALAVVIAQRVELEALLFCERCNGGRIDAATEKNYRIPVGHGLLPRNFGSFHGVALLVPADDSFIEHFHVAETVFVENAIGQTGQVMGARSIEDDRSISRNAF